MSETRADEVARCYAELEAIANRIDVGMCGHEDAKKLSDAAQVLARMASDGEYAKAKTLPNEALA